MYFDIYSKVRPQVFIACVRGKQSAVFRIHQVFPLVKITPLFLGLLLLYRTNLIIISGTQPLFVNQVNSV